MTSPRTSLLVAVALAASLLAPVAEAAPDPLAEAKNLYVSAAYDEALAALDRLPGDLPAAAATEAAEYRAFCLLALDRRDEARRVIERIITDDPFYVPSEAKTSPRIRTVFQDIRRELLPQIVQRLYADAKAAFERKDPQAAAEFERLVALLSDPELQNIPSLADLRTVAAGFRDLSNAVAVATVASPPPPAVQPLPAVVAPPPAADTAPAGVSGPARDGDPGVTPPVTLTQALPSWKPPTAGLGQTFSGRLEVTIDEEGKVTSVVLLDSVHPLYDGELVKAARQWRYAPALRAGAPVAYVKVVEVRLAPLN